MTTGTPRGIRNRNPGNIVVSGWTQRQPGYVGPEAEGRFATFDTMAHGVEALLRLLLNYRNSQGLLTVRGKINRWAPPVENNTSAYVTAVARALGVGEDDVLPEDAATYGQLAKAIVAHENGRAAAEAGVSADDYSQALIAVFGSDAVGMRPAGVADEAAVSPPSPAASPVPAAPPPDLRSSDERAADERAAPPRKGSVMSPLLIPAISAVVDSIPSLVKLFGSGSKVSERNAAAVQVVADVVKSVAGEASVAAAAEKVMADPALQAKVEAGVRERWFDLQEAGGGGIEAARKADAELVARGEPLLRSPSFVVAAMLIPLVYLAMVSVSLKLPFLPDWPSDIRVAIISSVVGMVLGGIVGYYFGMMTSRNRSTPQAG